MRLPVHNKKTVYWFIGNYGIAYEQEHEPTSEEIERAKSRGHGIYYVVNQLGDIRNEKQNLKHSKNITAFNACFVDLDDGTKPQQLARLQGSPLPCSEVVESGRGYHGYWVFEYPEAVGDRALWRATQRTLAAYFGGDKSCNDEARLMRMPDTWHVRKGYEPSMVRSHTQADWVYSLDEIVEAFHVEQPEVQTRSVFVLSEDVRPLMPCPIPTGERHQRLLRRAGSYLANTPSSQYPERLANLKAWFIASASELDDNWEQEFEKVVSWVAHEEFGHTV